MKTFVLITTTKEGECVPFVMSRGTAETIEDIVELWVDPTTGWLPDHIENIEGDYDEDVTDAVVKEMIKAEAIRITRERFGIGCERSDKYSGDYIIVEVDLATGEVEIYGSPNC